MATLNLPLTITRVFELMDLTAAWYGETRPLGVPVATHPLLIRHWDQALPTAFSSQPERCLHLLFAPTILQGLRHPYVGNHLSNLMDLACGKSPKLQLHLLWNAEDAPEARSLVHSGFET